MSIDINMWERKPEFPAIVQREPCQICGAGVGQPCKNLSAPPATIAAETPRSDFHQHRKLMALTNWGKPQPMCIEGKV